MADHSIYIFSRQWQQCAFCPWGRRVRPSGQGGVPQGRSLEPKGRSFCPVGQGSSTTEPGLNSTGQGSRPSERRVGPMGPGCRPLGRNVRPSRRRLGPGGRSRSPAGQNIRSSGQVVQEGSLTTESFHETGRRRRPVHGYFCSSAGGWSPANQASGLFEPRRGAGMEPGASAPGWRCPVIRESRRDAARRHVESCLRPFRALR